MKQPGEPFARPGAVNDNDSEEQCQIGTKGRPFLFRGRFFFTKKRLSKKEKRHSLSVSHFPDSFPGIHTLPAVKLLGRSFQISKNCLFAYRRKRTGRTIRGKHSARILINLNPRFFRHCFQHGYVCRFASYTFRLPGLSGLLLPFGLHCFLPAHPPVSSEPG